MVALPHRLPKVRHTDGESFIGAANTYVDFSAHAARRARGRHAVPRNGTPRLPPRADRVWGGCGGWRGRIRAWCRARIVCIGAPATPLAAGKRRDRALLS